MFARTKIAFLCLGWFVLPSQADEQPKFKPIDPETIAAYEKLGAKYGGIEVNTNGMIEFRPRKEGAAKRLPGFTFVTDGALPKLPPVQVPFGLNLSFSGVTNAALKELKDLKNLTTLDLDTTEISDAGLKRAEGPQEPHGAGPWAYEGDGRGPQGPHGPHGSYHPYS